MICLHQASPVTTVHKLNLIYVQIKHSTLSLLHPKLNCDRIAQPIWNRLISLQIHRYRHTKYEASLLRKRQRNFIFRRKSEKKEPYQKQNKQIAEQIICPASLQLMPDQSLTSAALSINFYKTVLPT